MLLKPLMEIALAIIIGLAGGIVYILLSKKVRNNEENLTFTLAMIFGITAAAFALNLSSLLTLMTMGIIISNFGRVNRKYLELINTVTPPIFVAFFVLSGADLNLADLKTVGVLGIAYVIARLIGKISGAYFSTKATGFPSHVSKYLGLTLAPQAGVAIGLSLIASQIIPDPHGAQIRTVVLGATIIYELTGPLVAKYALKKSGCIASDK